MSHTCDQHGIQTLKIKSLELNIVSGKIGYRTQNFGIIPSDIRKKYQKISVKSDEYGSLAITVSPLNTDHTNNIDISILKSPLAQKPLKIELNNSRIQ